MEYKPYENVTFNISNSWDGTRIEPSVNDPVLIESAWSGNIVDENVEYNHSYSGLISQNVNLVADVIYPFAYCGYVRTFSNTLGPGVEILFRTFASSSGETTYSPATNRGYIEDEYIVDTVRYQWPSGQNFDSIPYTGIDGQQIGARLSSEYTFDIDVNVPIFDSYEHMVAYVYEGSLDGLLNGENDYELEVTKTYYIYNQYGPGKLFNGSATSEGDLSWRSLRFNANATPILYFTEGSFLLNLRASKIVNSCAIGGPGYMIDYRPEESWTEGTLETNGPFYGNVVRYGEAFGELPENGNYTMGFSMQTNIPIFKNQADAEEAIEEDNFEKAINAAELEGTYYAPPKMDGTDEEAATTFGSGAVTSPFVSTYIMSRNMVLNVANAFYSDNTNIIDNIKRGLELFGAEPFQALCGLTYFPFNASRIATTAAQNYIYFGSYKHEGVNVEKVVNLTSGAYIDAGTVTLTPVQNSYRNFEPYCGLSVYLPYIGWQKLNIADYIGKTVNVRYYVDIYTRACAVALVANGVFIDYFTGEIGINLPITGQNLSQYANSTMNALLGTAGGTLGGAVSGAMIGSAIPGVGNIAGGIVGAGIGLAGGIASGAFTMSQKGLPKDKNMTRGNFSSGIGSYLPQYVMFRFDVHDLIIPDNLTELYGRPSAASGRIGSFSGFLQCDTVKLNASGMSDAEQNEVLNLLKSGIFV